MRQILVSMTETETPADLRDGEVVEAIRLGGPRDGDSMGYFKVELAAERLNLEPFVAREWHGSEENLSG